MRKMKLDLNQLAVESFSVRDGDADARGTVRGNAFSALCAPSWQSNCPGTCELSCDGSCATGYNCRQVC